jgi:hypothetical protein
MIDYVEHDSPQEPQTENEPGRRDFGTSGRPKTAKDDAVQP